MKKTAIATVLLLTLGAGSVQAQSRPERRRAELILDWMHRDIQKLYFDSTFNGVDLERVRQEARADLKSFESDAEVVTILANSLKPLRDSHTYFIPPAFKGSFDYGFEVKFFGETALISNVKAGSSAEKVGLRKGDQVTMIDGQPIRRSTFSDLAYEYHVIAPRKAIQLVIVDVDGRPRQMTITTKFEEGVSRNARWGPIDYIKADEAADSLQKYYTHHYRTFGNKAFLWRMKGFWFDDDNIRKLTERAVGYDALIIDLRGNGGGAVETLKDLVSHVVDFETDIATVRSRTKTDVIKAKPAKKVFNGRLFVLVDSESGSASEVFARLVQLLGRGTVIGDRTAGAVRTAITKEYYSGGITAYASISISDVKMPDGGLLEGEGVQPNEMVVPKNYDLAEGNDPVLAYALSLAGVEVDAKTAAKLYTD
jgi:carboxyl-terminal processing protease